jgi:hypothetical protein
MIDRRYKLEPYSGIKSRYTCPACGKHKTFARYIDTKTGDHLDENVGKCNREINCGYHYKPKRHFEANKPFIDRKPEFSYTIKKVKSRPVANDMKEIVSIIPTVLFQKSLKQYNENNFVQFLKNHFGSEITCKLISKYFIGTSKLWKGATVFWQIDIRGKIRTGKIMLYSVTTGKRIKEPHNHINWVHSALKLGEFHLQQCLFGEHLLKDEPNKPVAIVESEKTAIIASVYLPQFIWLAVGSLTNLTAEKCGILKRRIVTLFPDLNGFEKWRSKAKELSHIATFTISDLLERKATEAEREQGLDLADYLIRFEYRNFVSSQDLTNPTLEIEEKQQIETLIKPNISKIENLIKSESWEQKIRELEDYFARVTLPAQSIKPNHYSTIIDVSLFLKGHFATVKANNGNRTYLSFLNRLQEVKQYNTKKINGHDS